MSNKPINYLANKQILIQIWRSKLNYSSIPRDTVVDIITDKLARRYEPGTVIRLDTDQHIPREANPTTGISRNMFSHLQGEINHQPFILYRADDAGKPVEIGKSHFKNGVFTPTGQMTDGLARQIVLLVDRIASKGNWRGYSYIEDMKADAMMTLVRNALKFNEARSDNPFAYFTTLVNNAFIRYLSQEKRHAAIRDDLIEASGHKASIGRQLRNEL